MRIGLVLGAGGVTGGAYLSGALLALENDLGWDPRRADVIVGTSAGSLVGALLRSGVPASDLAAWAIGAQLSGNAIDVLGSIEHPHFDPIRLRQFLRPLRVPRPSSVWSAVRHPAQFDPLRALLLHMHDGNRSLLPDVQFLGDEWPDEHFYTCAVRRRDGARVVFGRDQIPSGGLAAAVAASCAVPGYFAPVNVDGALYLDGGVASSTNAAALRDDDLDLVIVIAPMSSHEHRSGYSVEALLREKAAKKLRGELAALEARGTQTVALQPSPAVIEHIGVDFMDDANASAIVLAAFIETGGQLQHTALPGMLSDRSVLRAAS